MLTQDVYYNWDRRPNQSHNIEFKLIDLIVLQRCGYSGSACVRFIVELNINVHGCLSSRHTIQREQNFIKATSSNTVAYLFSQWVRLYLLAISQACNISA
jgi:hypothetical protein